MVTSSVSQPAILTVIVILAAIFSMVAVIGRASWTLAKATLQQLEATRSNTQALDGLTKRVEGLEQAVNERVAI